MKQATDYTPDPRNANRETLRGRKALEHSLRSYGAGRSILVDRNGVVIAGNKTLQQAAELGLPVIEVETDGHTLVAVKRRDLDLDEDGAARALAYADNISGALGFDLDPAIVAEDMEIVDLSGLGYDRELEMLAGQAGEPVDPDDLWKGMPEFEQEDLRAYKRIVVNFANEDDYQAFAQLVAQRMTPNTRAIWYPELPDQPYVTNECVDDES
jgi:uncharacterized protein YciU (UPF0263 family)